MFTYEAKGYRDLYWCYRFNEPFVNERTPSDEVACPICESVLTSTDHRFMAHIHKPEPL